MKGLKFARHSYSLFPVQKYKIKLNIFCFRKKLRYYNCWDCDCMTLPCCCSRWRLTWWWRGCPRWSLRAPPLPAYKWARRSPNSSPMQVLQHERISVLDPKQRLAIETDLDSWIRTLDLGIGSGYESSSFLSRVTFKMPKNKFFFSSNFLVITYDR